MHDVRPEQYAAVIRDMIKHENDVTNHRTMWLLIAQGFISNAFVFAWKESSIPQAAIAALGILVSFPAFVTLYQSYQARGYLLFLGQEAKQGKLSEAELPIAGWPAKRIKGWWKGVWSCRYLARFGDLLEPWLFLPYIFISLWLNAVLWQREHLPVNTITGWIAAMLLGGMLLSAYCVVLVWLQEKDDEPRERVA